MASIEKDVFCGTGLFSYCSNDPIDFKDPTGSIKRTISRWTAETLIDTFMYIVAPALASQLNAASRMVRIALNAARRLLPRNIRKTTRNKKMLSRYSATIKKAYQYYHAFINKLVRGFVPRVLGVGSRLLTAVRKIIWRATGVTIKALTTYSLKRAINQAVARLQSANHLSVSKVGKFLDTLAFAAEFVSVSGFIAIWLDGATDGRINNTIRLW